jgi:hypothetical protein
VNVPGAGSAHALWAGQLAGVLLAMSAVAVGWIDRWGAWLPLGGWFVATALVGRRWSAALRDREALKQLALGSGWRSGALLAALALAALWSGAWTELLRALLAAALVGFAGGLLATMLTLIGLDAGRTTDGASPRSQSP